MDLAVIGELLELRRLLRNRRASPAELQALQARKLRAAIRHAYQAVPYYHSLFQAAGISPDDIRTLDDLRRVPITTKANLRAAGAEKIVAGGLDLSSCLTYHTSGSTGEPFAVALTRSDARIRRLVEFRGLHAIGFRPRDRLVFLGPEKGRPPRLHHRLGLYRPEVISPLLPIEEQIRRLREARPTLLWVYPNVLRALLHAIGYRLSTIARPRALVSSAEPLPESTRRRLRADLDIEIFDFYGAIEVGRIAVECTAHDGLHVNADHLILERLEDGQPTASERPGTVVLTSLNATGMPFIRYHLGDTCTLIEGDGCACGSSFPRITPPRGREWDMMQLPSGKFLSASGLGFILRSSEEIDHFRFIQETVDHFVLQLVPLKSASREALQQLRMRILEVLGEHVRLDVQVVDFIQEDALKFKAFVSKVPQAD